MTKNKLVKNFLILLFFVFIFLFAQTGGNLKAASNSPETNTTSSFLTDYDVSSSEPYILANISIYNATITKQSGNNITISFQIADEGRAQPNVRYAVYLMAGNKDKDNFQSVVDYKVYPEILNLKEGQTIEKVVSYKIPSYLNGKFEVWVISQNDVGLPLGQGLAGEVSLSGDGRFIYINQDSCYLTINDDKSNKKYYPEQGVDIQKNEVLTAHCLVKNKYDSNKIVYPYFDTYFRSIFGKKIGEEVGKEFSFKPNEAKNISFTLPKVSSPQAYEVVVVFKDSDGNILSNKVNFHYVISGESATIQNIRLDKTYYKKGDFAKITFNWTVSANCFQEARTKCSLPKNITAEAAIKNYKGKNCSNPLKKSLNIDEQLKNISLNIPIIADCLDPNGYVVLKDGNGKILGKENYHFKSGKIALLKHNPENKNKQSKNQSLFLGLISLIILIGLLTIYYSIKKKTKKLGMIVFLLVGTGMILLSGNVKAVTFGVWGGRGHTGDYFSVAIYSVNLNKKWYKPGEYARISAWTRKASICNNGWGAAGLDAGGIGGSGKLISFRWWLSNGRRSGRLGARGGHSVGTRAGCHMGWAVGYGGEALRNRIKVGVWYCVLRPKPKRVSTPRSTPTSTPTPPPTSTPTPPPTSIPTPTPKLTPTIVPTPSPSCNASFSSTTPLKGDSINLEVSSQNCFSANYTCSGSLAGFSGSIGCNGRKTLGPITKVGQGTCIINETGPGGSGSCKASTIRVKAKPWWKEILP